MPRTPAPPRAVAARKRLARREPTRRPATPSAGRSVTLDAFDLALMEALRADGRASNRALAELLGVHEATIGPRLRRLEEAHAVRVVAITDMEALGHEFLAFCKVRVSGRPVREVAADFAEIPENIAVVLTIGQFDLMLSVLARDRHHLTELVTEKLVGIQGVESIRCELGLETLLFRSEWGVLGTEDRPVEPRAPSDRVDELDLAIIDALQRDARSSNRRIAAEIGVSEGTVRARIKRMEDEHVIRIVGICDVNAIGFSAFGYVGITVESGRVREVGEALTALPEVSTVVLSLGDYDLLLVVTARSRTELAEVIMDRIATIPGVRRTDTVEGVGVAKHSYTWVRLV